MVGDFKPMILWGDFKTMEDTMNRLNVYKGFGMPKLTTKCLIFALYKGLKMPYIALY